MKKRLPLFLSILLLITLILGTGSLAAANTMRTATVDVSILNVRSGPGLTHARVDQVMLGTVLPVLAEQPGWVQISLGSGKSGWVSSSYVTLRNNTSAVQQPALVATVNVSLLNVRSGAGTQFSVINTVAQGTVLTVITRQGDWLQVRLSSGQTGWIAGQYTLVTEALAVNSGQAPVVNTPAVPGPVQAVSTAVVNVSVLNVRSGPGISFERITTVPQGARLTVLQKQGDWLKVSLPTGQTGWVLATYAPVTQTSTTPPPSNQNPAPAEPPAGPQRYATVKINSSTAWSGPGFEHRQVAILAQGSVFPVLSEQGGWVQVRLQDGQVAWIAGWLLTVSTEEAPPSSTNPGGSPTINDPAPTTGPSPVAGKVIVIDPGHGGTNPGAVGVTGLLEKVVVLDVSLRVAEKLRQAGATVVMTRSGDSTLYLANRVTVAQSARAHAFVSIHANAHPDRNISGTETYYYRNKANYLEGYYLAAHLQNELVKALGLRDIGIKHGNFHVIRETTMPSALVELAFLSNHYDESLLKTSQFRENAASAIFRGLERFFQF
jgi:N-acetylmuramoyl-L-alanine amidase